MSVLVEDLGCTVLQLETDRDYYVERGRLFGYPECCVQAFASDVTSHRFPALRRGTVPDGNGGQYVPCGACCDLMGRVFVS